MIEYMDDEIKDEKGISNYLNLEKKGIN